MGYWNTRGLRGSTFEQMINLTNEMYRTKGLALIQKVPTSITPTRLDPKTKTITQAYFEKKSTVDYIGVVQGIAVCFDAKETERKSFPMQNIHTHQIEFMRDFEKQKGIAFLLVSFSSYGQIMLLPFKTLYEYYEGGKKSIPYEAFDKDLIVESKNGCLIHYLEALSLLLQKEGTE